MKFDPDMFLTYFISLTFAVLASRIGAAFFCKIALKYRLVDKPDAMRKLQKRATPVGGGLVVFLAVLATTALAAILDPELGEQTQTMFVSFALAGTLIVAVGLYDDKMGMNGIYKLLFQILVATLVVVFAKDYSKIELFGWEIELGHLFYPLAICWLVALMNAINFLDGADGVVATFGFYIFTAIGAIGVLNDYWGAATLAFIYAATLLGFFGCNRPPARLYLGDAGSLSIGFAIGVLLPRVCSTRGAALQVVPMLSLVVVPLADVVFAVVRRANSGRSIFSPDRGHIHHRLQRRFGKGFVLLGAITMIQIPFCLASVAGVYWRDDYVSAFVAVALFSTFVATRVFGKDEIKILYYRLKYQIFKRIGRKKYDVHGEVFHPQGTIRWVALWENALDYLKTTSCVAVYLDVNMPFANEDFYSEWNNLDWKEKKERNTKQQVKFNIPLVFEKRIVGRLGLKFDVENSSFSDAAEAADKIRQLCLAYIETELAQNARISSKLYRTNL